MMLSGAQKISVRLLKNIRIKRTVFRTHFNEFKGTPYPATWKLKSDSFQRRLIRRFALFHRLQVTSFGGAGTTLLLNFLEQTPASLPQFCDVDWAPWKHQPTPPADHLVPKGFKAIYLVSDPRDALVSIFRRKYQHYMIQRIDGDLNNWKFDWELDDYLGTGRDLFGMSNQFDSWTSVPRSYPILIIHYDALWDHLDELMSFAGVSTSYNNRWPEKRDRKSNWESLDKETARRIDDLYGPLAERIESMPKFQIRLPNTNDP